MRSFSRLILATALFASSSVAQPPGESPVRSLLEQRTHGVVVQRWDLSCGAAALATLLNRQYGDPVDERSIARALVNRDIYLANPDLIRARQGFSLLDLKWFAEARGYEATGYGDMDFEMLVDRAPMIVPVIIRDYPHFVIFRGTAGNRVLLADPAYGQRSMSIVAFLDVWKANERMGRIGFAVTRPGDPAPPNRMAPGPEDFVMLR